MIEDRSALGYLIKVIVILLSHRRVVVAIGAGILLVGVGHVSCRHVRDARRATAWMENEFGRLGDTVDQILSHEGDDLAPNIAVAINYQICRKAESRGAEALSPPERKYQAMFEVCRAVRTSGFEVYFLSPAADHYRSALAGLEDAGAVRRASILKTAVAVFPDHVVPERLSERQNVMNRIRGAVQPVWLECDVAFKNPDEPLNALLLAYVKSNKAAFTFP